MARPTRRWARAGAGSGPRSTGGFNGLGQPVELILTPGQASDLGQAEALLTDHTPEVVIADRGYDKKALAEADATGPRVRLSGKGGLARAESWQDAADEGAGRGPIASSVFSVARQSPQPATHGVVRSEVPSSTFATRYLSATSFCLVSRNRRTSLPVAWAGVPGGEAKGGCPGAGRKTHTGEDPG